jgi:hypothetical protein
MWMDLKKPVVVILSRAWSPTRNVPCTGRKTKDIRCGGAQRLVTAAMFKYGSVHAATGQKIFGNTELLLP